MTDLPARPSRPAPANFGFHPLEYAGLLAVLLICVFPLRRYAPWPITWDDLLYLHTAWHPVAEPSILNRYVHIYSLMFFSLFARGNPFVASQIFGSVLSAASLILTYLNARLMAGGRSVWAGCVAVLFLAAHPGFASKFGVTLPDHTIVAMLAAGICLYLLHLRIGRHRTMLAFLFGLLLVLAYRSKETGLMLIVLVPGFLLSETGPGGRANLSRLKWIAAGVLAGLIFLAILNGIVLKDPWFGLRPSEYGALIDFNTNVGFPRTSGDYLGLVGSTGSLLAPFLLALVWVFGRDGRDRPEGRWVWLVGVSLIIFLDLTLIRGSWDVINRYLLPVLPVIAVVAAQSIQPHLEGLASRGRFLAPALGLGSLLVVPAAVFLLYSALGRPAGWDFRDFLDGVVVPIALCLLLGWLAFWTKRNLLSAVVVILCAGAITVPAGIQNARYVLSSQLSRDSLNRYIPFELFKDQVACLPGRILISESIFARERTLSRDQQSSRWMFNLYFGCNLDQAAFTFSPSALDVLTARYQYAFLDEHDMDNLLGTSGTAEQLAAAYRVLSDEHQRFYLLILKP